MSNDKMGEEFEAWSASHDYLGGVELDRAISGNYSDVDMQHAWESWKSSREALVIELPPVRPEPIASGDELKSDGEAASWNIWVGEKLAKADCREAIEAAGLKVKP